MREIITTKDAPGPTTMYSQATRAGDFVFISGQLGMFPGTRDLVDKTLDGQARQALHNIRAIAEAAGGTLDDIVKVTVFLKNASDWPEFNKVYFEFFPSDPPARSGERADRRGPRPPSAAPGRRFRGRSAAALSARRRA